MLMFFIKKEYLVLGEDKDEVYKMRILAHLTEKRLEEILINCYKIVEEKENLNVIDLIEDIKRQVISSNEE